MYDTDQTEAVDTGRALASHGMNRAAAHADRVIPQWSDAAREFAGRYINSVRSFTSEDLRDAAAGIVPDPPDNRAWGIVLSTLAKARKIRRIGFGTSRKPNNHARPIAVWGVCDPRGIVTTANQ